MFTLHYHITFVGMKRMLQSADSCQSDALQIAAVAKGIRKEIFESEIFRFSDHFPPGSLCDCIPYNLKLAYSIWAYSEE